MRILQRKLVIEDFFEKPFFVKPTDNFFECLKKALESPSGKVIVLENRKLKGIFSVMDIISNLDKKPNAEKLMKEEVISLEINEANNIENVVKLMKVFNVGSIPIVKKERFIGLVTEKSIINNFERLNIQKNITAKDIMTPKPFILKTDYTLKDSISIMKNTRFKRFPVVDNKNNLKGVFHAKIVLKSFLLNGFDLKKLENKSIENFISLNYAVIKQNSKIDEIINLAKKNLYGIFVLEENELLGIITEKDVIQKIL